MGGTVFSASEARQADSFQCFATPFLADKRRGGSHLLALHSPGTKRCVARFSRQLQYNRARWYAPEIGRWISEDPLGFVAGDANVGRYVGNDPTGASDPSGLHDEPVDGFLAFLWSLFFGSRTEGRDNYRSGQIRRQDFNTRLTLDPNRTEINRGSIRIRLRLPPAT